jgi:hypothetical protein
MAARPTTTAVAEEGHIRRRLHVTFPPAIVTRCAEQVFCFGGDGHTGATRPSTAWRRRRVYRRNRDGTPDRILAAITLDIDDITTA